MNIISRLRWVWTAAFDGPVVVPVGWMKAASSGFSAAARYGAVNALWKNMKSQYMNDSASRFTSTGFRMCADSHARSCGASSMPAQVNQSAPASPV